MVLAEGVILKSALIAISANSAIDHYLQQHALSGIAGHSACRLTPSVQRLSFISPHSAHTLAAACR